MIKWKKKYLKVIELNNDREITSLVCNNLGVYYKEIEKNYDKMKKFYLMGIELNNNISLNNFCEHYQIPLQHYLLRQINSRIAIEKVKELEKNNFLGVKIFKELTEYCFNPQRLLKLCNIYNVELNDYMDFI